MSVTPRTPFAWKLRRRSLALGARTLVMGILNVTPDSFSDGGRYAGVERAVEHGVAMLDEGADIVDIGGESTRPDAMPVSAEEEQGRVLPVLAGLVRARPDAVFSTDTYHASTAKAAVEAGAEIVNDVSGMTWDGAMAGTCAALGCGVVLVHTRGRPGEWSGLPGLPPVAVMPVVLTGLRDALLAARRAGVASDRIVLDPGLGFGKRERENYAVLALLGQLRQFGLPVLAGSSRKGFLRRTVAEIKGRGMPDADAAASGRASLAAAVAAVLGGAHVVRVHDVPEAVEAVAIADAVLAAAARVEEGAAGFVRGASTALQ